jgi:hypothetical protein
LVEDLAVRHLVLGALGLDCTFRIFLGAPWKDQWHRSKEEVDQARLPHLVIRAGDDIPPNHVWVPGDSFAALAAHLAPGTNSPWGPVLGDVVQGGQFHQLDWVHKETGQRLRGQAPPIE